MQEFGWFKITFKNNEQTQHAKSIFLEYLPDCWASALKIGDSTHSVFPETHIYKVVYTSKTYYDGCMHKRNRHMIDHSSLCICYITNSHSGTGYTVQYANERGQKVINLAK